MSSPITAGAPSERALTDTDTRAVPTPTLVEGPIDLPPRRKKILVENVSADGFVLRMVTTEAGREYTYDWPITQWNTPREIYVGGSSQIIAATPVTDAGGAVTAGAFTIAHASRQ